VQDFSPYWVCQGFYYFVEINGHGGELVMVETLYRDEANFKSVFCDIQI
jgi:creatinine amidohydrolase/Fe(II)-dependent formamide hydrolase-like protein